MALQRHTLLRLRSLIATAQLEVAVDFRDLGRGSARILQPAGLELQARCQYGNDAAYEDPGSALHTLHAPRPRQYDGQELASLLPCANIFRSRRVQREKLRWQHSVTTPNDDIFIYQGPLAQPVRNLKRLSIAGCIASLIGGPILILGAGDAMPIAAQASLIASIGSFGIFTTSLLHWFTSPYVHTLEFDRKTGSLRVKTMNIVAQPVWSNFHVAEATYPDTIRPQVTFEVKRKFFYLDADSFSDKRLLASLTPLEPSAPDSSSNAAPNESA